LRWQPRTNFTAAIAEKKYKLCALPGVDSNFSLRLRVSAVNNLRAVFLILLSGEHAI
jgi:hypothetical protein